MCAGVQVREHGLRIKPYIEEVYSMAAIIFLNFWYDFSSQSFQFLVAKDTHGRTCLHAHRFELSIWREKKSNRT